MSSDLPISNPCSQPQSRNAKKGALESVASLGTRDYALDNSWDRERKD